MLHSKQLLRAFYGNCSEKEFIKAYKKAKMTKGNTGVNFIKILEHRLDTILFRMRFANTFEEIRQFITHKHILVNGNIVNSPTYQIRSGDSISVRKTSFDFIYGRVLNSFEQYLNIPNQESKTYDLNEIPKSNKLLLSPDYMEINYNTLEGIFIKSPNLNNVI